MALPAPAHLPPVLARDYALFNALQWVRNAGLIALHRQHRSLTSITRYHGPVDADGGQAVEVVHRADGPLDRVPQITLPRMEYATVLGSRLDWAGAQTVVHALAALMGLPEDAAVTERELEATVDRVGARTCDERVQVCALIGAVRTLAGVQPARLQLDGAALDVATAHAHLDDAIFAAVAGTDWRLVCDGLHRSGLTGAYEQWTLEIGPAGIRCT